MDIFPILLGTGLVSLVSLSGITLLVLRMHLLERLALFLVALAAGGLLGAAFFHLLPEAVEEVESPHLFLFAVAGYLLFFFLEKILHWHHSHETEAGEMHAPKGLGVLSLVGDGVHNFLDGLVIGAAFFADGLLGFATVAAVVLHEAPQEIAEFGVLLYAGFSRARALVLNFLSATTVILGGVVSFFFATALEDWVPYLLMFGAGIFLYISASDFVPEIRSVKEMKKSLLVLSVFLGGIFLMWIFTFFE